MAEDEVTSEAMVDMMAPVNAANTTPRRPAGTSRGFVALRGHAPVRLLRGDMRTLPVKEGTLSGVCLWFTPFGYFSDGQNRMLMNALGRLLRHGGVLIMDYLNAELVTRTLVADYSFGMKKKLALCAALIHGPKLLFLDEPFEGIDAITNRTIKDILLALQQKGVTLVLTSHILEVVEKLCPLIAIIDEGKLKGFGTFDELRQGKESLGSLFVNLVGGAPRGGLSWL